MSKKKNLKKARMWILPIAVIALLAFLFLLAPKLALIKQETIGIDITVIPGDAAVGINIDTDALHYGSFPAGFELYRIIGLTNERSDEVITKISFSGDIAPWMNLNTDNKLLVQPNTESEVIIYMTIPVDAEPGDYIGQLNIVYAKNVPWLIW